MRKVKSDPHDTLPESSKESASDTITNQVDNIIPSLRCEHALENEEKEQLMIEEIEDSVSSLLVKKKDYPNCQRNLVQIDNEEHEIDSHSKVKKWVLEQDQKRLQSSRN